MEKGETWRTHGEIMDGDLWKHRLCPDFGSWWWWNFLSRSLFAFFFFSLSLCFSFFLLLINPLWIRQISKLMQMRVTGVAVSRPPLLCTCNDTERLSLHNSWFHSLAVIGCKMMGRWRNRCYGTLFKCKCLPPSNQADSMSPLRIWIEKESHLMNRHDHCQELKEEIMNKKCLVAVLGSSAVSSEARWQTVCLCWCCGSFNS